MAAWAYGCCGNVIVIGIVGFAAAALLSLSLNSTGFSMNVMCSVFSSVWFMLLLVSNKYSGKVDWSYRLIMNFIGSSIGGILSVIATTGITAYL